MGKVVWHAQKLWTILEVMYFSTHTTKSIDQIFNEFGTSEKGLSEETAAKKLKTSGHNELTARGTHWYDVLVRQFTSPFLYLLIGAATISFLLGHILDGSMILLFVAINALFGFYQEYKSEQTLKLLKRYIVATTKVYRNGHEEEVDNVALVPGDVVLLQPGDVVPADIRLFMSESLTVNESILTGESVAIVKSADVLPKEATETYQATNCCFSGTIIISGEGKGVVIGTGKNTVIGTITTLTVETHHKSSFEKSLGNLSSFILKLISITLVFIVAVNIFLKGADSNIPTLLVFAIALAISVIPEALPVVTTFSFAKGALLLAKNKVVVKRLSAIEDLGSIEILCTDKTGTITENKMSIHSYFPDKKAVLFAMGIAVNPTVKLTDSFDLAIYHELSKQEKDTMASYTRLHELPFDPKRKYNSVLVKNKKTFELYARGAAEKVLALCKNTGKAKTDEIMAWVTSEGTKGRRVLAVAKKVLASDSKNLKDAEKLMSFVGLVSFIDPLKPTAHLAIKHANELGVQVKILTGDSPDVAGAIAFQAGLIQNPDDVILGDEFDAMSIEKKHEVAINYAVFARVSPEQKHAIIQLLQENHEVGFLGEGINDAPALKAANVAIVVQGASDIARDTADIVLLHKSLNVVIDGIREGRKIFGNTVKYIKATLASNFGNFYTVSISSLFIDFLPLLPLQILLINLLTDFPMIAVATDNVDTDELKRPRSYDVKEIALFSTVMGIVSSFFDFIFFILFYQISPQVLQTNWFIGSILTELVFLFAIRTRLSIFKAVSPSRTLLLLSLGAFITAIVLPFTVFGQKVFEFVTPTIHDVTTILLITWAYFIATECVKLLYYKFISPKNIEVKPTLVGSH